MNGVVVALPVTPLIPTSGAHGWYKATDDQPPIGQHVFDPQDNDIGQLEGFIDAYGTRAIIIEPTATAEEEEK